MEKQKYYFGGSALIDFQRELHTLAPKTIFLLRGKKSYELCGAKKVIEEICAIERIKVVEWYEFEENPKIEDAKHGVSLLQESGADVIVACGGGSVLDMAKLVRFASSYKGDLTKASFEKTNELIPLFAIPTTAGTGCEATPFAVCYKDRIKYSVEHKDMLPNFAIVYPPFTFENSAKLTASTGFDALAQAIEAYWNKNSTPEADCYALKAIELIYPNLPKAVLCNDNTTRACLSQGAYFAGKAIAITKTTAPHAFSYAFTTYCSYAHGHAVALTFPFFLWLNATQFHQCLQNGIDEDVYSKKMEKLLEMLGMDATAALNQFETYINRIGLICKGCNHENLDYLLSLVNLQRLGNNPVKITPEIVESLHKYLERVIAERQK